METIFKKIIEKKIISYTIYSDSEFIIILDINPKNPGHSLIIPKKWSENVLMMNDKSFSEMFLLAKNFSNYLKEKLNAEGIKWVVNSGKEAGQVIFHTHLHLIPYYKNVNVYKDFEIKDIYERLKNKENNYGEI
ncbi:MAG: hypothetical protein HPAVJP_1090 [Candidatus Hepatoplasma vulgare]|nr:MAG: hypothetical protein HPAVJP_1090 [Candidatus Hepatoplasma sp.]